MPGVRTCAWAIRARLVQSLEHLPCGPDRHSANPSPGLREQPGHQPPAGLGRAALSDPGLVLLSLYEKGGLCDPPSSRVVRRCRRHAGQSTPPCQGPGQSLGGVPRLRQGPATTGRCSRQWVLRPLEPPPMAFHKGPGAPGSGCSRVTRRISA